MARIRTIKPEFPEDETLGNVSRNARFTFVLLWTRCDDHGRFRAAAPLLRCQLYPYDDDLTNQDLNTWLDELVQANRIVIYEVDGQRYGQIINWGKHQRIDNAAKSAFPEPPCAAPAETRGEPRRTAEDLGEPPRLAAGREGKGREGKGTLAPEQPGRTPRPRDELWDAVMDACGVKTDQLTTSARGSANKAVSELRNIGAQPQDVPRHAHAYRRLYPNAALTPTALAKHWAATAAPPPSTPSSLPKPLTDDELARLEGKTA